VIEHKILVNRLGTASTAQTKPGISARRECSERVMAIRPGYAELLGLEPGTLMHTRTIKLLVGGTPVLIATSYIPAELKLTDEPSQWQNVDIDALALSAHTVTPAEFMETSSRWPTNIERQALGIPGGAKIPLTLLTHTYAIQANDQQLQAGVIVLVRGDRAHLHWGREYQGLVLLDKRRLTR
jgi:DNA-binding GntR family transcriptional regulator